MKNMRDEIIRRRPLRLAGMAAFALIVLLCATPRAAFEDMGAGARATGMGNAFVPVADDIYAIHYNPAGLGTLRRPEFGASYTQHHMGLSDQSNLSTSFLGYVHPLAEGARGTIGAAWNSFSLNTSLYRENTFYLSYGRLWLSHPSRGDLFVGTSLKYLHSSFGSFAETSNSTDGIMQTGRADPLLTGGSSHGAMDADLGFLYRFYRHYSIGLHAAHLNQPDMAFSSNDSDRLPLNLKLGLNYRSLISNLVAQIETQRAPDGSQDKFLTIAAERWFPMMFVGDFGARGALGMGTREYKQISLGLSYRTRRLEISYGFTIPIQTIASTAGSHRMGLTFRFGRATDEEESLEVVLEAMRQLKEQAKIQASAEKTKGLTPAQWTAYEEYMAQSRSLMNQARYKGAMDQLSAALTIVPATEDLIGRFSRLNFIVQQFQVLPLYKKDPVQAALHQGILAYTNGQDLAAIEKVSLAHNFSPKDEKIEMLLAQLENMVGIKRLTGIQASPKSLILETKLTQAEAALGERQYRKAIKLSLAVLREDGRRPRAWQNLGTAYFALKDYDSSLKAWEKAYALEKSPSIREAIRGYMMSVARLKRRQPRRPRGVTPLPERPALQIAEVQALFNQGIDHYTKREFKKAHDAFRRILDSRPDHDEARRALRRVEDEMR